MKTRRFFLLLLFPFVLHAQASVPRYQVEVLIFENLATQSGAHEVTRAVDAIAPKGVEITQALTQSQKRNFVTLAKSYFTLNHEASLLQRSGKYRVLLHSAWVQPITSHSDTVYFASNEIARTADVPLTGTLTFNRAKFLDLAVQVARGKGESSASLSEQRRIKTREINYFDNPRFGMLIRVVSV